MEHPAKFTSSILDVIEGLMTSRLAADAVVLDPFAGIGGIHALPWRTVGVELEPEWSSAHPDTLCGDSTELTALVGAEAFDAVITSPAYGNRMADSYAGDPSGSRRVTYRISLGRPLTKNNGGGLQWGDPYRDLHLRVWAECLTVLRPGGLMVVNVSNHIRSGSEQRVVEWHLGALLDLGFMLDEVVSVDTPRMRFGANSALRVDSEKVLVLRSPM